MEEIETPWNIVNYRWGSSAGQWIIHKKKIGKTNEYDDSIDAA